MNLPNKLTLMRIILIPVVVAALLLAPAKGWALWLAAGLLFGVAAITDLFDGKIARARGLVTDFGKLMDPVADKLLVTAVFVCFVAQGICSPWVVIIILAREFLVTSVRMVASSKGTVIPANMWGKAKTVTQMTAIVFVITAQMVLAILAKQAADFETLTYVIYLLEQAVLWISALATVISGAVYIYDSRELFKDA